MTRDTAWLILTRHLTNPTLLKHSLATEATMRSLAIRLGQDPDEWGITGLLHDADYEKSKGHPEKHGEMLFRLEPNAIPSTIEHAIRAHNFELTRVMPESKLDWGIICCDDLTLLIFLAAEKQPDKKLLSLSPEIVIARLNDKHFAKEANRKNVFRCEDKLGITLPEFATLTLTAMQQIAPQLEQSNTQLPN